MWKVEVGVILRHSSPWLPCPCRSWLGQVKLHSDVFRVCGPAQTPGRLCVFIMLPYVCAAVQHVGSCWGGLLALFSLYESSAESFCLMEESYPARQEPCDGGAM